MPVHCRRGPAELMSGLPLVQRSYLGVLLPESLLHMLEGLPTTQERTEGAMLQPVQYVARDEAEPGH